MSLIKTMVKRNTKAKWKEKSRKKAFYLKEYNKILKEQPKPNLNLEENSDLFMNDFRFWLTRKTILIEKLKELDHVIEEDSTGILEQNIRSARAASKQ